MTTEKIRPDKMEIICFWTGLACLFAGLWAIRPALALIFFGAVLFVLSIAWYSIRKSEAGQ